MKSTIDPKNFIKKGQGSIFRLPNLTPDSSNFNFSTESKENNFKKEF